MYQLDSVSPCPQEIKESTTCSDYILKEECLVLSCYYLIFVQYDSLDKAPIKEQNGYNSGSILLTEVCLHQLKTTFGNKQFFCGPQLLLPSDVYV
jgi:hypothetical protein